MGSKLINFRLPSWPAWKWITLCLLLVTIASGAITAVKRGGDLESYLRASRRLAAGENIYVDEIFPYMYPPFLAFLLTPLIFVSPGTAKLLWYLANISFIILSFVLLFKLARAKPNKRFLLVFLSLLFTLRFLGDSTHRGQVNILILFLCVLTLYFFNRARLGWAALFLAMAIAIKLTALLLVGYFLFKRKFRFCGLTAACLVLVLLLPAIGSGFNQNIRALKRYPTVAANIYDHDKLNQSLPNAMFHLFHPVTIKDNTDIHVLKLNETLIKSLTYLLILAMALFPAYKLRGKEEDAGMGFNIEFSIVITLMLLFSPVSRKDHFVTLLIPYFFYFHSLLDPSFFKRIRKKKLLLACLLGSFLLSSATVESVVGNLAGDVLESYFCVAWGTLMLWIGLLLLRRETADIARLGREGSF
jgi:hypothetical protein